MLKLKFLLQRVGRNQAALSRELGLAPGTVAQIVNHGAWPKSLDQTELQTRIRRFLTNAGAAANDVDEAFEPTDREDKKTRIAAFLAEIGADHHDLSCVLGTKGGRPRGNADGPDSSPKTTTESNEEKPMLLRKQPLYPATRKHFGLFREPFSDDSVQSHEDMFLSPDIRYVREAMYATARHGGLLAVIAESGAGKTTILRDLEDRIVRDNQPILVIRPYVLASEDNEERGKALKSTHIAEAIMAAVAPLERPKSSPEARFAQLHKALRESHAAGYKHCLVIDEGHSLSKTTLKHLKRFIELEVGFKKLLSVILIGQPELKDKLSERDAAVREVVQRCEIAELLPLDGGRLDEYLKFKLDRCGKPLSEVIDADGINAMRSRLMVSTSRHGRPETLSLLYPLAVGNLLTAAMNLAADLGVPMVTADVIKGV